MIVKKNLPCSLYDIQGMQDWLDEMALQGLFLKEFSYGNDRAVFEMGDPRPVRYRLDPVSRNIQKDKDREEPYAQMGWQFVTCIRNRFYIFSCDDPEAPELYNDPQSLALAMEGLIKRESKRTLYFILGVILVMAALLFWGRRYVLRDLLLWEDPQSLVICTLSIAVELICLPLLVVQTRAHRRLRDALAQGLPPKAKKRWNRPRFLVWYIPFYCLLTIAPRLFLPNTRIQVFDLGEIGPSHPWPSLVQTETAGSRPLEAEPVTDGYVSTNDSWFAPVQEYISTDWRVPGSGNYWTGVEYVQARSPMLAQLIFQLKRDDTAKTLDRWTDWNGHFHVDNLQPFQPRDWPGLDRLEVAQYTRWNRDCWTLAARRGTDVLVVEYIGYASWEDCLPLFLAALDQ